MQSVSRQYELSEQVLYRGIRALVKKKATELFVEDQSTIPIELAEELLESISFTMQYFTEQNMVNLSEFLKDEERFLSLYDRAETFLNSDLKSRELDFSQQLGLLYKLHNRAYVETVFIAISSFFKHYDTKFKANDYIITADYPLLRENRSLKGLLFINDYIKCLMTEQSFMASYTQSHINAFLKYYHREHYELIYNISELVFHNGLLSHLLKRTPENLILSKNDIEMLYVTFLDESPQGIYRILFNDYDRYMISIQRIGTACYDYYLEHLSSLSNTLHFHCKNESLQFFLVCQY